VKLIPEIRPYDRRRPKRLARHERVKDMRQTARWGAVCAVAAALVAGAVAAVAQDKLAEIKARQDLMERQEKDVKAISEYGKGNGDQATAIQKLEDLIAIAPTIPDHFQPGTSEADFPGKTHAKAEAWQDLAKLRTIALHLRQDEERLLVTVKSGDQQKIGPQLIAMYRDNCTACHTPFRAPYKDE
jgi:cytochrome c556